jgi:5-methylcytosine-specific restriction endonuclease McrA
MMYTAAAKKKASDAHYRLVHKAELALKAVVRNAAYYQAHKLERRAYAAVHRKPVSAEKARDYSRQYRIANPEGKKASNAGWQLRHKEVSQAMIRAWWVAHLGKRTSYKAKRRAAQFQATPPWLTTQHLADIEKFYVEAARLQAVDGIKRHVDHIYPLQGKTVCGLHVPWNLQILTATANSKKHNKMPNAKQF